jgi:hypothetical protein
LFPSLYDVEHQCRITGSKIPITVPYSVFFELPCAEAAGHWHKHMRAMNAKRIREREEAMHRDLAGDG